MINVITPFFIGICVATIIYSMVNWWGFWLIFPWVGLAISIGNYIVQYFPQRKKLLGRKVTLLMIMPLLLFFIPIYNSENFQLEGIMLNILVGYFTKSFVHLAVAKLFGPLFFGRGFCGWACWTAAILEWLPINSKGTISPQLKNIRYITFLITVTVPVIMVFFYNYDVRNDYLYKKELLWMLIGNFLYYVVAIALAYRFKDKRAFCKIACPIAVVMTLTSRFSLLRIRPSGNKCVQCGLCNKTCPMDVDVMSAISTGKPVQSTECIYCGDCKVSCPVGAIK
jgi:polyferredoxin